MKTFDGRAAAVIYYNEYGGEVTAQERQDFVDNAIYQLLVELSPTDVLEWDIEMIGEIRDVVGRWLVSKGACTAEEFYPKLLQEQ